MTTKKSCRYAMLDPAEAKPWLIVVAALKSDLFSTQLVPIKESNRLWIRGERWYHPSFGQSKLGLVHQIRINPTNWFNYWIIN